VIPFAWTWRDLGRAFRVARWAFYNADKLAMLKHELNDGNAGWDNMKRADATRLRCWLAQRYLGDLPIS
jgi:hypothetical protein